ncbi:hypothetical protein DFH09DRAFT_1282697 [Mycena vulgaris]|nr:hypothetical protein DFH09DRAFT_1282697 [Mycena vulgaris]
MSDSCLHNSVNDLGARSLATHSREIFGQVKKSVVRKLGFRAKELDAEESNLDLPTKSPKPALAEKDGPVSLPPTVDSVAEMHATLIASGIKVRDFAYRPTQIGHLNPADEINPGHFTRESYLETYYALLQDPPSPVLDQYGPQWSETDPRLLPPQPVLMSDQPVVIPTPDSPFVPLYPTHRITGKFNQRGAMIEHDYRLSQTHRTRPIRGLTSRRLLSLGPGWVDFERYTQMDIDALARYDNMLFSQNLTGGVYPWVPMHQTLTPPAREERDACLQHYVESKQRQDARLAEKRREREKRHEREGKSRQIENKSRGPDDGSGQELARSSLTVPTRKKRGRDDDSVAERTRAGTKRQKIAHTLAAKVDSCSLFIKSAVAGSSDSRRKRGLHDVEQGKEEAATVRPRKRKRTAA